MQNLKRFIQSLTDFSEESWAILSSCLTELQLKKGALLLKEGEACRAVFFISSGYCKACYTREGKEINTDFFFENDFATNTRSLVAETPSEYEIRACEPISLVRLDKTKLLTAYQQSAQVETFGRKLLERIVARQEEHAATFKLLSPKQRFEHLLVTRPEFLQRVSLTQTASYLGMSRETLSRLRRN